MLFFFFKSLFRIATLFFFSKIHVRNKKVVERKKPMILIANHPSAFMDPIIIGCALDLNPYFAVRGESFKSEPVQKLFEKIHMMPVYRQHTDPDKMHKNKDLFSKIHKLLLKNKTIFFFPEGISKTERRLRQIQKGLSRIALFCATDEKYPVNFNLLPVGLNYTDPHRFQGDVFMNIGEPIPLEPYIKEYKTEKPKAVNHLTEKVTDSLTELIIVTKDDEEDKLLEQVNTIYKEKIIKKFAPVKEERERNFLITKRLSQFISHLRERSEKKYNELLKKVMNYFSKLNSLKLIDAQVRHRKTPVKLFARQVSVFLGFVFGLPIHIYGLVNHFIASTLVNLIIKKAKPRPDFKGSLILGGTAVLHLIFYIIQSVVLSNFVSTGILLIYIFTLPFAGIFAVSFFRWIRQKLINRKAQWFMITHPDKLKEIIKIRDSLNKDIDDLFKEFVTSKNAPKNLYNF